MGRRSKITQLPREVRAYLDKALVEGNFSGYEALAAYLRSRGIDISRGSIQRYGANLQRRLSAIKASTEAAGLIAAQAPDDAAKRSAAVIGMIQSDIFEVLMGLQEASDADPMQRAKLLSTVAKNVATLARADIAQKRHELALRAKEAAERVASLAKKGGLSADTVDTIKREILGIAA